MAISRQDRALDQALLVAAKKVTRSGEGTEQTRPVRALVHDLVLQSRETLITAVAAEDKEDTEAEEAADARQEAYDVVRDAYARLYAGLMGGASMAVMRGEDGPEAAKLRKYLGQEPPANLNQAGMGQIRNTVRAAEVFMDRFIPKPDREALRSEVQTALADAEAADQAFGIESGEAATARTALFKARDEVRETYLAARDLLAGVLRLEGDLDRLNVFLPPYERFRRLSRSTDEPASEDAEASGPSPAELVESLTVAPDGSDAGV